jgi:hypothetical protein
LSAPITHEEKTMNAPTTASALQTLTLPALAEGEVYAGILLKDGIPTHHVILLPGEAKAVTWKKAKEWAAKQGGELPTRKEQALLFANAADKFERDWYWSGEQHADDESSAWAQHFNYGGQYYLDTTTKLRARAVRRIPIE